MAMPMVGCPSRRRPGPGTAKRGRSVQSPDVGDIETAQLRAASHRRSASQRERAGRDDAATR